MGRGGLGEGGREGGLTPDRGSKIAGRGRTRPRPGPDPARRPRNCATRPHTPATRPRHVFFFLVFSFFFPPLFFFSPLFFPPFFFSLFFRPPLFPPPFLFSLFFFSPFFLQNSRIDWVGWVLSGRRVGWGRVGAFAAHWGFIL